MSTIGPDIRDIHLVADGKTAFVDEHHDGLDALRFQFRHQRVHGVGLVREFQTGDAWRRNDRRRALQGQAMKATGIPSKVLIS